MPRGNRFLRYLSVVWDRDAARRLQDEAEAALGKAGAEGAKEFEEKMQAGGAKGARALTTQLQRQFRLRQAQLSQQLADGVINERAFRREGEKAAREFNAGLSSGIKRLQGSAGGLTDAQFAGLGSRFKPTGGGPGVLAALFRSPLFAPVAGLLTATEGLRQARESIAAADELANSIRKLGGTAKITGLDLAFLEKTAGDAKDTFRLSTPIANDLTTEVAKLAAKAGDIDRTSQALESFLNIGAARGLTAQQTLDAVGQAILGIDEGTDKLFSKNPSTIYEEWANQIGRTAESLTDQEKAQALLDATIAAGEATRGEYARWQETAQGRAADLNMQIREMQAELGTAIQPLQKIGLEIKLSLVENLVAAVEGIKAFVGWLKDPIWASWSNDRLNRDLNETRAALGIAPIDLAGRVTLPGAAARPPVGRAAQIPGITITGTPRTEETQEQKAERERLARLRQQEIEKNTQLLKAQSEALFGVQTGMAGGGMSLGALILGGVDGSGQTPLEKFGEDLIRVEGIATDVAGGMSAAFQDAFSLMIDEGINVSNFFEGMARGIAASVGQALAEIASKEAAKSFAYAISMGAHALGFGAFGNLASAAAASGSAGQHIAAGIAWSALAGASAAGAGAARTRGPGSTFDAGLSTGRQTFENGGGIGAEFNIIFNGPDALNPEFERTIIGVVDRARERYPEGTKINIRSARR